MQQKTQPGKSTPGRLALLSAILLWFIAVGAGLSFLWSYENAPGLAAAAPSRWPNDSRIKPAPDRATLVMLIDPQCPCTRASIEELDKLMAHCQGRVNAYVGLMKPHGFADDWVETDLWRHALRIRESACSLTKMEPRHTTLEQRLRAKSFCMARTGACSLVAVSRDRAGTLAITQASPRSNRW